MRNIISRYSCDQCANAFRRLHFLMRHMQTRTWKLATLDNRYSCDQCANAFRRLHFLMRHMQTRTGKDNRIAVISVQTQLDVYVSSWSTCKLALENCRVLITSIVVISVQMHLDVYISS